MVKSATADKLGILNIPNQTQIENLKYLCETLLEPTRTYFQKPIKVSSGFRNRKLNTAIGGSFKSQHCIGEACDFEINGVANKDVADWMSENLLFDQIILEFYNPKEGVNSGWIHASLTRHRANRGQKLIAKKDGLKTIYLPVNDFNTFL